MRNLHALSSVLVSDSFLAACRHIAIDYDTKLVYCTTATCIVGVDVRLRKVGQDMSVSENTVFCTCEILNMTVAWVITLCGHNT